MTRNIILSLAVAATSMAASNAQAQFSGGPPSPERIFGFIDRDRNGVIDRREAESAFGPARDVLLKHPNIDRGISQKDFEPVMAKMMEERSRDERDRERDRERERERDREREKERERERIAEQQRAAQSSSNSSSKPSTSSSSSALKKAPAKKQRITQDLPRAFQAIDLNGDGQIGLYEWDRAKYAEFQAADANGDGLLTAKEILAAKISPAPAKTATTSSSSATIAGATTAKPTSTTSVSGTAVATTASRSPTPSAPVSTAAVSGKGVEPIKVDADSSDGRMAKYIFGRLDLDKDGSLTEAEWSKSQSVRQSFEKLGAKMPLPIKADDFAGWQVAVQKAERTK